jgi:hypothetical protein
MKQHLLDSKAQSIVYRGEHGLKTFEKIIIMSLNVECCVFTLVEPEVFYSAGGFEKVFAAWLVESLDRCPK